MSQTSEIKLLKRFDQNVEITGNLTVSGTLSGATDTNYYLDGITKSGNTLTFSVNGATNQTYTFGSNAFTSYTDHSTQGYLTSFDITTQTDPKYLRSNATDTATGTLTFDGNVTFNNGPYINPVGNALYFNKDASERNVIVFQDQGTEQWDLWMRNNGELSWESDVNGLFTVASDFRAEGDATITGKIVLGSSANSDYLTGNSRMSVDGYIMLKGIVNASETGTGPAAIVFGDGSTLGNDKISLVTNGNKRLYINSSGVVTIYQDLNVSGDISGSNLNISNWDTAYSWGNHASAGYLTSGSSINADTLDSLNSTQFLRSDANDTTTGTLTIQKSLADNTFLNLLNQNTSADLSQQKSFIDFTFVDANTNETPQVRIGAEVGQNADADTQEKEGSGAFVVYTNNADTISGSAGTSLAERFRVDYQGRVGVGINNPSEQFEVNGDVRIYGSGSTIGGATVGNASLLIGSSTTGIGIDNNEIHSTGAMYIGTNSSNLVLRPSGAVLINTTTTTGSAKLVVNGFLSSGSSAIAQFKGFIRAEGQLFLHHDSNNSNAARLLYDGTNGLSFTTEGSGSGNFGIGTSSPSHNLTVNGNARIQGVGNHLLFDTTGSDSAARITAINNYELAMYTLRGAAGFVVAGNSNIRLGFGTSQSNAQTDLFINQSGNVGINTTSPTDAKLQIDSNNSQLKLRDTDDGTYTHFSSSGNLLAIRQNSTTASHFWMNSSGNVGLGTNSPSANLHIASTGDAILKLEADTDNVTETDNPEIHLIQDGGAVAARLGIDSDNEAYFWHYQNYDIKFGANNAERMRVKAGGFIGMGCTDPQTALEIRGAAPYLTISNTEENNAGIYFNDYQAGANPASSSQSAAIKWSSSDNKMRFYNNDAGGLVLTMDMNYHVGIGTEPSYRLHVDNDNANTNNAALYVRNPNSSSSAVIAQFVGDSDGLQIKNIAVGDYQIRNTQQGNAVDLYDGTGGVAIRYNNSIVLRAQSTGGVEVTGAMKASGDVIAYSSDERLKENVKPIENALDKLMQIKGVTFDWKDEIDELGFEPRNRKNDVGVIAQDIEKVLPQLIAPAPFDSDVDKKGNRISKSGQDYVTVQYDRLNALLIEAVKELSNKVKELENKLNVTDV